MSRPDPNSFPDWDEIIYKNQEELDSRGYFEILNKAKENRRKYLPHGIETIWNRSKPLIPVK